MRAPVSFQAVQEHFGFTTTQPVEKDWHMVRAMAAVAAVDARPFRLVFAGGTCMARAHRLIQRMSEDVDFKIVPLQDALSLSNAQRRKLLGELRDRIVDALREADFTVEASDYRSRNDNRYMAFHLPYAEGRNVASVLRPTLQVELTYAVLRCAPVVRQVSSFVAEAYGHAPEVASIECVSVTETAAEKIVALTRRTAMELAGLSRAPDPNLVRHIFDLHQLREHVDNAAAAEIVQAIATADGEEFRNQYPAYAANAAAETVKALDALRERPETRTRYGDFMTEMVYGGPVAFDLAMATVEDLARRFGLVADRPDLRSPLFLALTIDTRTAAFEDIGQHIELARLLDEAAEHLARDPAAAFAFVDTNGNRVGNMERVAEQPASQNEPGVFQVVIEADANAAERLREMAGELRETPVSERNAGVSPGVH